MKSLVIVLAMTLCLAFSAVAEEGTDVTPSPGDLVTPSPQDDEVMKKTLRQAREERRRKVVIASYCQPVIQKLKRSETNESASLTMDNCHVTGFAGGDFLTLRQGLQAVTGVADVQLGYMGGWKRSPTYREVCLGGTGHTEMVIVTFNKEETNYTTLLDVFFRSHNSRSRVQKGDFAGIQFKSMVYLLDHPQLWEFAQMKKKLDAMPEYKQDSLWVLTEPTALKERPNNFFPEFGSEDSLLEIRVQTREKVESKLTKVRDNLDKIAKEAEKDLENLKKENATGPIILVEKDVGEDQAAKYAKASDSEKKKIESERDEMMKTAAAKARTLRRKLEDDLKIEELRQKNIARRAKIAAEMEAEAKVKAQKEAAEKKDTPVEKKEEKKEDSPVEKKEEKKEDPPAEKKEDAPAKVEKKKEDGPSEKKEKQEETPAKKEDAPVEKKEDKKEEAPVEKKEEKKEDSPAEKKEEKKEEPTEKKDTAPVEKKEDPPAEKKDDAPVAKKEEGEKKEETPAKKEDAPVEKKEDKKEAAPVEKKEEKKEDSPAEKKEEKKEDPTEKKDNAPVEKKEDPPAEKKDVPVEKKEESPVKKEDSAEPEKRQAEAPAKEKAEDPAPVKTES